RLRTDIEKYAGVLGVAKTLWNMGSREGAALAIQKELEKAAIKAAIDKVEIALEGLFDPRPAVIPDSPSPAAPESELLSFRRAEFNVIRNEVNSPELTPDLRVIPAQMSRELAPWLRRVNFVERLRETRAFYGFDRIDPTASALAGMPDA